MMILNWKNPFGLQGLYESNSALQGLTVFTYDNSPSCDGKAYIIPLSNRHTLSIPRRFFVHNILKKTQIEDLSRI